jgi:hypothetical protein
MKGDVMKTKKYLILTLMVVWAVVLFAAERSYTSPLEHLQRQLFGASTLEGVKSVLSGKDLKTQVVELLRKSQIEIAESVDDPRLPDAPLSLNVTVFLKIAGEDNSPIYAAFVTTEVLQPVKLLRNDKIGTLGRTWPIIPMGIETQCMLVLDSQTIRQKVNDEVVRQVNRFINDYLAANPKPSPPPTEQTREDIEVTPREIVVDPIGSWSRAAGWGGDLYRSTRNARTNTTNGHLEFIVEDANSLHVWRRYGLSVSISDYPIVVFTYRARNVAPGWYTIWMDDGAGPWGGCTVFRPNKLIVDGKIHEIRADLRKVREVHKNSIKKLNEKGTIKGMALGVRAGNKTPAVLEFIDLRFMPEK